jgi:uncharacterized protein YqeY
MKTQIRKDMMGAMKSGDTSKRDILRVLMGEIQRNEQSTGGKLELTDSDIIKLVKKMVENIKQNQGDDNEVRILNEYLPKSLSESELESVIGLYIMENNIFTMKGMGEVMKFLSESYPSQYDGKLASTIIRNKLT